MSQVPGTPPLPQKKTDLRTQNSAQSTRIHRSPPIEPRSPQKRPPSWKTVFVKRDRRRSPYFRVWFSKKEPLPEETKAQRPKTDGHKHSTRHSARTNRSPSGRTTGRRKQPRKPATPPPPANKRCPPPTPHHPHVTFPPIPITCPHKQASSGREQEKSANRCPIRHPKVSEVPIRSM